MSKNTQQYTEALLPATPPAAVTGLSFAGIPLQEWVYILTILYTVLSIAWLVYKAVRWHIDKEKPDGSNDK